ncbi:hypothetical protein DO66_6099 [Burkholderia pseudomallei]|nr:hypothetical protein DO66_6099 [Burkholderia pseudomallei]
MIGISGKKWRGAHAGRPAEKPRLSERKSRARRAGNCGVACVGHKKPRVRSAGMCVAMGRGVVLGFPANRIR